MKASKEQARVSRRLALGQLAGSVLGGALSLTSLSCEAFRTPARPIDIQAWLADPRDLMVVRRVLALPVEGDMAPIPFLDSMGERFRAELAASHRFQVLSLERDDASEKELWASERKGRLSVNALVALGKRFQVDGILLLRVTSFRPYLPPVIGLQVQLISVHSGDPVWVVDETFDSSEERIRQDLVVYRRRNLVPDTSLHGDEMIQLSPRRYAAYCSKRVIETLQPQS